MLEEADIIALENDYNKHVLQMRKEEVEYCATAL